MQRTVSVPGAVTIVAALIGGTLLGMLGALLAIPATLFLKSVLLDNSVPASWVNALVSSSPAKERPRAVVRRGRELARERG
jgi:predicted PurR-regulated permease PerM